MSDVIAAGLIGVGGTLLGGLSTWWLQAKGQERQWTREEDERRLLAYVNFATACRKAQDYLGQLISPREWKQYRVELVVRQEALLDAGTWLNVLARNPVKQAADRLSLATLAVIQRVNELHMETAHKPAGAFRTIDLSDSRSAELRDIAENAYKDYLATIRAERA